MVYRTFLYSSTNLKVHKRHRVKQGGCAVCFRAALKQSLPCCTRQTQLECTKEAYCPNLITNCGLQEMVQHPAIRIEKDVRREPYQEGFRHQVYSHFDLTSYWPSGFFLRLPRSCLTGPSRFCMLKRITCFHCHIIISRVFIGL